MREIAHPHGGDGSGKKHAGGGQHQDRGKIPAQGFPGDMERGFKNQRRKKRCEQEFFGEAEPR
jgi:hypothetical protein